VLDSGRYIAFVVDIVATVIVRIGWISKMSGAAVRDCTKDGVFVIIK
jgi:hypothetical protein